MKRTSKLSAGIFWLAATCLAAHAAGIPRIQFDETVYDFGKTSQVATVSGVFKFKNVGDGLLKIEPPMPSCGCTVAELKPDTLAPGATGELTFTLNLGQTHAVLEKHIGVRSNDPQTPDVSLIVKVDYTPLYEINPIALAPVLAFGVNDDSQFTTLTRTDGKPLSIGRLASTRPWITATVEPGTKPDEATARIRIAVKRNGPPRRFSEYVHFYTLDDTNIPVASVYLSGQVMGEVSLTPESMYWSLPGATTTPPDHTEATVLRRVTIRSASGQSLALKNPQSTIKGLKVELVPKEAGKVYELVARFEELPTATVSGMVSFDTSVASQPRIEVPVVVNILKP